MLDTSPKTLQSPSSQCIFGTPDENSWKGVPGKKQKLVNYLTVNRRQEYWSSTCKQGSRIDCLVTTQEPIIRTKSTLFHFPSVLPLNVFSPSTGPVSEHDSSARVNLHFLLWLRFQTKDDLLQRNEGLPKWTFFQNFTLSFQGISVDAVFSQGEE